MNYLNMATRCTKTTLIKCKVIANLSTISPLCISIPLRYCSNESMALKQKIPKISENNNLSELIDDYSTREYDKNMRRMHYNQQRFMDKRKRKLEEMLSDENQYHPVIFSLLSAKTGTEIFSILDTINTNDFSHDEIIEDADDEDIISDKNMKPTIHRIYSKAMRCCADLDDFDTVYQIFETCKSLNIVSNELYNTMMWCEMYQKRDKIALDKVFHLCDELQQLISNSENNLKPHPRTYSTLINSCIKVRHYHKGLKVLSEVKKLYPELMSHSRLQHAEIQLLNKSNHMDNLIEHIENLSKSDENIWINWHCGFGDILYGLGKNVYGGFNADLYTNKAENIFKKCVSCAMKNGVDIPIGLFNGMMSVYARNNDYNSCYEMLQFMISNEKKHKLFPSPNRVTFEQIILSLVGYDNNNNEKWNKLDEICELMDSIGIHRGNNICCFLMNVCGNNLDRVMKYYNELIDINKIKPNMAVLRCLCDAGLNHYKDNHGEELQQFIRFVIDQHSKYNIVPTEEIKQLWKTAMTE